MSLIEEKLILFSTDTNLICLGNSINSACTCLTIYSVYFLVKAKHFYSSVFNLLGWFHVLLCNYFERSINQKAEIISSTQVFDSFNRGSSSLCLFHTLLIHNLKIFLVTFPRVVANCNLHCSSRISFSSKGQRILWHFQVPLLGHEHPKLLF